VSCCAAAILAALVSPSGGRSAATHAATKKIGFEGAPAVRQATTLTISSRAPTTRDQSCQPTGWKDRGRAVGGDRACGGGGGGGEALRRARRGGGHPLSAFVTPDVYGHSERRFGDGSAAAAAAFASCVAKGGRRKQGLVPDIGHRSALRLMADGGARGTAPLRLRPGRLTRE
jgi:hypothetical protein